MAPNAENNQTWRFVVVTDRDRIAELGRVYAEIFRVAGPAVKPTLDPAIYDAVEHLATSFGRSPAVIVVGALDAPPAPMVVAQATWWGSVLPAVQNLILAARAEGVGATLTTLPLVRDAEIRAVIGAPDELTAIRPAASGGRPANRCPKWRSSTSGARHCPHRCRRQRTSPELLRATNLVGRYHRPVELARRWPPSTSGRTAARSSASGSASTAISTGTSPRGAGPPDVLVSGPRRRPRPEGSRRGR